MFEPQQYVSPSLDTAHACRRPAVIDVKVRPPTTVAGPVWNPEGLLSPRPSCPWEFFPQHCTSPPVVSAQVNL